MRSTVRTSFISFIRNFSSYFELCSKDVSPWIDRMRKVNDRTERIRIRAKHIDSHAFSALANVDPPIFPVNQNHAEVVSNAEYTRTDWRGCRSKRCQIALMIVVACGRSLSRSYIFFHSISLCIHWRPSWKHSQPGSSQAIQNIPTWFHISPTVMSTCASCAKKGANSLVPGHHLCRETQTGLSEKRIVPPHLMVLLRVFFRFKF